MKLFAKLALITGVFTLLAAPAYAGKPEGVPKGKDPTPGPKAGLPAKAKAYGRYCKWASKKHVKGEKGTEFSRCVTAMAKAANNDRMNPSRSCKGMSKKGEKGQRGSDFSNCVRQAAKLQRQQKQEDNS